MTTWTWPQLQQYLPLDIEQIPETWTVQPQPFNSFEIEIEQEFLKFTSPEVRLDLMNLIEDGRPFSTMQRGDLIHLWHNRIHRFTGYVNEIEFLNDNDVVRIIALGLAGKLKQVNLGQRNADLYGDQDWHLRFKRAGSNLGDNQTQRPRNRRPHLYPDPIDFDGVSLLAYYYGLAGYGRDTDLPEADYNRLVKNLFQGYIKKDSEITLGEVDTSDIRFLTYNSPAEIENLLKEDIQSYVIPQGLYQLDDPVTIDGQQYTQGIYWIYTRDRTKYTLMKLENNSLVTETEVTLLLGQIASYGFVKIPTSLEASEIAQNILTETMTEAIDVYYANYTIIDTELIERIYFYADDIKTLMTATDSQQNTYMTGKARATVRVRGKEEPFHIDVPYLFFAPYDFLDQETYLEYVNGSGASLLSDLARYGLARWWVNTQGQLIFRSWDQVKNDPDVSVIIDPQYIHGQPRYQVEPIESTYPQKSMNLNGYHINRIEEYYENKAVQTMVFEYWKFPEDGREGFWCVNSAGQDIGQIVKIRYFSRSPEDMHVELTCRRLIDVV